MKMIKKESKISWQNYKKLCQMGLTLMLSLSLFSCAKKVNPFQNYSREQCMAYAKAAQLDNQDLHGEVRISLRQSKHKSIKFLADFQVSPEGKMLLSIDKLGFNLALAVIDQEQMYLWQAKQQSFWHGSVSEGLNQLFALPLTMQDLLQMFYISWDDTDLANIKEQKKFISFGKEEKTYKVAKKNCVLSESQHLKNPLNLHIKKYVDLASKKRLPKEIHLKYQNVSMELQFNQVFEQDLNEKKWLSLKERFLAMIKKSNVN